MKKISRIGVLSVAKLYALMMAAIALIPAVFIGLLGSFFTMSSKDNPGGAFMAGLGIFALVILPIVYGIFGFIAGAIGALIYNLIAKFTGGIEVELK